MARINTSLAVTYTNDFGQQSVTPIPFKIHRDAPIPDGFYQDRPSGVLCSAGVPYRTRYIRATFLNQNIPNGGTFQYPVPNRSGATGIIALATALNALGALCLDLVGERWNLVTNSVFGGDVPNFRTTPYDNIPGEPDKTSVTYTYNSDIAASIGGQFTLSTSYETLPTILATASSECLINAQEKQGVSICSGSALGVKPRRFLWKAGATDTESGQTIDGTIARQSIISSATPSQAIDCLREIAPAVFCSGYRGEDIRNIQNIASLT